MNKYFTLIAASVIAASFFSCSKKSNVAPPITYSASGNIVKQDDTTWFSALGPSWVVAVVGNGGCQISAIDTFNAEAVSKFTFTLENFNGVGTYSFDSTYFSFGGTYGDYETITPVYTQTAFSHCKVEITEATGKNISGSFSGTLTDGSVANGSFIALHN